MYVGVHDIRRSGGLWKTFEYEGPLPVEGLDLVGPVKFDLRLTNAVSRILVEGPLRAQANLVCCRCAETFLCGLETEVEESFVPEGSPEAVTGPAARFDGVFTFADERIEVDELMRQELLAAVPMQPVCRPDCKGLCPGCGVNLNTDPCTCAGEDVDPRWAPLLQLQSQEAPRGGKSKGAPRKS